MDKEESNKKFIIEVCRGFTCQSKGADEIYEYIKKNMDHTKYELVPARCLGECSDGPNIVYDSKTLNKLGKRLNIGLFYF